jgi:hypothetical protein
METRAPNEPLAGHVRFHCDLSSELATGGATAILRKRQRPASHDNPSENDAFKAANDNYCNPTIGWIFEPTEDSSGFVREQCYFLAVPQCYEAILCQACCFHLDLQIVHYEAIPFSKGFFGMEKDGLASSSETLIWIPKQDGALILPSFHGDRLEDACTAFSLEQLCQYEEEYNVAPVKPSLFSFRGTVAFISPILAVNSKDPFVLVELIQETTASDDETPSSECRSVYSVVVVLRAGGIQCASAICPHDTVVFKNIRKQQWRVPDVLLQHQWKISKLDLPSKYVFVADSTIQVQFVTESHGSSRLSLPLLPSSGIASFEGVIKSVHLIKYSGSTKGHSRRNVHFLEILTSQRTLTLFVTYYPIATAMQCLLSLFRQFGTMQIYIRASNVENLGCNGYAANLYSQLAIVDCTDVSLIAMPKKPPSQSVPKICFPFHLSNQRRSYRHFWICRLLWTSVINDLHDSWPAQHLIGLPSQDDITNQFLSIVYDEKVFVHTKRNLYAEFFDRSGLFQRLRTDSEMLDSNEVGNDDTSKVSDFLSLPISLRNIQESSFNLIRKRLKSHMDQNLAELRAGWTGSIHLIGQSLHQNLAPDVPYDALSSLHFYTLGHGTFTVNNGMVFCSISNGSVILPIVFCEKAAIPSSAPSSFVWMRVQGVCVTCLCIGPTSRSAAEFTSLTLLPPYFVQEHVVINARGSCGLCILNGHIFVISLFLVCDMYQPISSPETLPSCGGSEIVSSDRHAPTLSLERCLNPVLYPCDETPSASIVGLLTRGFFRLGKLKSGVYSNYTMTLSHVPTDAMDSSSIAKVSSTLQSIEVKPSIALDSAKVFVLRNAITLLIGENHTLTDECFALGVIWWKVSSCPWTCALLGGGWDEFLPGVNPINKALGVVVQIPASSMHRDPNRGYTRLRCSIDDVVVSMHWMLCSDNILSDVVSVSSRRNFDYCGLGKFVAGMLDRRPTRRRLGGLSYGELLLPLEGTCISSSTGIARSSLNELTVLLCLDLQFPSKRYHLAPSLVREIKRATFLGIMYCRARAECAQCYATLYDPQPHPRSDPNKASRNQNHGIKSIPMPCSTTVSTNADENGNSPPGINGFTSLTCPNGCRVDLHGTIKWECSGVLDDGTGHAKLYAEREAALCLLGLPRTTMQSIERALWQTNNAKGFVFSKSVPPPSYLRESIVAARARAKQHIQECGKDARLINDGDVIQFLGPGVYGAYLFYQHCRTSMEPMRELIYFVRCKPLSDAATSLNQTEIETINDSDQLSTTVVHTYSLPPLQLNLVDCSCIHC